MVRAENGTLSGVLEGKKQYQVPLYQRVYSWGKKQLDQLWVDVAELADTLRTDPKASHFIGSLVLASSPDSGTIGIQKYLVVDGQQRLTTLTLLLAALRDHLYDVGDVERAHGIDAQYLINVYDAGKPHKVEPTQADRDAYSAVLGRSPSAGGEDNVGEAYRFFRSRIAAADDPDDPHDLALIEAAVVRGLALVVVTAEPGDNAHRIFESLNNTGLRLTQSDLLKNYLFMRLGDRAATVYANVWLPLEKRLDADNLELLFWLDLVQTDERAKQSDTYIGQQRRLEQLTTAEQIEAEVLRVAKLGDVLATILNPEGEPHLEVRRRLTRIRAWGSTTAYPVVMQILARRAAGAATDDEVAAALTILESYFVRRIVIGRATANLNRTLLDAVGHVSAADRVDVGLRDYLSRGRKYFATDKQVRDAATSVAFYWQGRAAQKKLILQWLEESYRPKEIVSLDPRHLTIEHVLPQTMTPAVRATLASSLAPGADVDMEHERLVHTLGNLTLSGYNSELSNKHFDEKRELLAKSGVAMNLEIAKSTTWGPTEIAARGERLAERIIELWPGPDEELVGPVDEPSMIRTQVAAIVAAIPAGRWTTYGDVALVASTGAQALAQIVTAYPMANAWRVLQSGGAISPGFRWPEPGRTDDPRDVLVGEGVSFGADGRADAAQFIGAEELAAEAGLDVDEGTVAVWRARSHGTGPGGSKATPLKLARREFFTKVREAGLAGAPHVARWRTPPLQYWYDVAVGDSRCHISLQVITYTKTLRAMVWIANDMELFEALRSRREAIETDLGFAVEWDPMPQHNASKLEVTRPGDIFDDAEVPELVEWFVEKTDAFAKVLPAYLADA